MRKICIINRKGGVGKTTTAVNLAAGLSRKNRKVLLVDLDPQSSVDLSLKVKSENSIYDALQSSATLSDCIVSVAKNFDVITSSEDLINVEYHLEHDSDKNLLLADMLDKVTGYDYIILDCPPSMGMLCQNALAFAGEAIVPTTTDFMGVTSLNKMSEIIDNAREHFGTDIKISKIVPAMFDCRNKICKESLTYLQTEFPSLTGYPIRLNSKLKEAPKAGKSIFSYAKSSRGAKDYGQLVEDVLSMESLTRDSASSRETASDAA